MTTIRRWLISIAILVAATALVLAVIPFWPHETLDPYAADGEWTCSMHPQIRRTGPGKCPICGMDLVPVNQAVQEKQRLEKAAGILTEPVTYRRLFKELRTVGRLDYNERQIAYIAARIAGRVDRVYADFTGIQVKKDDHLVDIYSPELVVTVQNLLDAVKSSNQSLAEIARERLRLWGILPEQIREIEESAKGRTHLTIYAPIGGTVIEKTVRIGQYVKEGDPLYRIADLDPIWLYLDVYEYDLAWVRFGQKVEVTVEAYPGEIFPGTVAFIDPFLDDKTRAVKARVNLANPQKKLKPAMYASALIRVNLRADATPEPTGLEGKFICPMHPEVIREQQGHCPICEMKLERVPDVMPSKIALSKCPGHEGHEGHKEKVELKKPPEGKVLALRASAVLDTGRRRIAYRQTADGAFELVELRLGPRAEVKEDSGEITGYFPVLAGLKEGDRVVIRGGFLLDSQRQIEGMPSLLFPEGVSGAALHAAHGVPSPKTPAKAEHKH